MFNRLSSFLIYLVALFVTAGTVMASPLDTWNVRLSQPTSFSGVTFGNGIFVTAGSEWDGAKYISKINTSLDGVTWTSQPVGTGELNAVAYGNGVFVAVGDNGSVLSSPDGVAWTPRSSGSAEPLEGICFGNGIFVAVATGGYWQDSYGLILTSPDGVTWTSHTTRAFGPIGYLTGVAYGNGLFAAIGGNGSTGGEVLITSTDGINWISPEPYSWGETLYSIAFGGGRFVAVGYNGNSMTSTDGSSGSWYGSATNFGDFLQSVSYGNGVFVAVGGRYNEADGQWYPVVSTSPDGISWTSRTVGPEGGILSGVAFGNGSFVAAGGGVILQSGNTSVPALSVTPGTLSFGSVVNGGSATRSLTLSNTGYAPLTIYSIAVGGTNSGEFHVAPGTCPSLTPTLAAGAGCALTVTLDPTSVGNKGASLQISSNDPETSLAAVPLSGSVVQHYPLTITVAGTGNGVVHSAPGTDIACASGVCGLSYLQGTVVTLRASAGANSRYVGWGGCDLVEGNVCTVSMSGARYVTANFDYFSGGPSNNLFAWGANYAGQLGNGTTVPSDVPINVPVADIKTIAGGMMFSLALDTGGTVWSWGSINPSNGSSPVPVSGNFASVAAGWFHALALNQQGQVWRWGKYSQYGPTYLGDLAVIDSPVPVMVPGLDQVTAVVGGGAHSLALRADGTVWSWGANTYGQLGNNTTINSVIPVQVSGLSQVIAIAAGFDHSLALKADGTVWAWGGNLDSQRIAIAGQLGNGFQTSSPLPMPVAGLNGVTAIFGGGNHSLALKADGSIWAWGLNDAGQIGDGTTTNRFTPVPVLGLNNVAAIDGECYSSIALKKDGTVWVWGRIMPNSYLVPKQVEGLSGITSIAAGMDHLLALRPPSASSYPLTISLAGTGNGSVNLSSGGSCPGVCDQSFPAGTTVTLTATANIDSTFTGWAGCDYVSDNICTVTFSSAKNITANFTVQPPATFVVTPIAGTAGSETYQYLTQWGAQGAGNGQFAYPYGVAVDVAGNVYVADTQNHRIQKFSGNGAYLTQWGSQGAGNGQFAFPSGVAVDASGNVYVADQQNRRIQKFDGNGNYLTQWSSNFYSPFGLAFDASGNVYVADLNNAVIKKFDANGTLLHQWGSYGTGDGQLRGAAGVAVDSSGNVYVTDHINHRVVKFDASGTYLIQWGSHGSGSGQFSYTTGITVDAADNVFVGDMQNHRVQKFDASGNYLTQFGSSGSNSNGQLYYPQGVAADSFGNIYVIGENNRVQKFSAAFESSTVGGSISPATPQTVHNGSAIPFVLTPNPGYRIDSVTGCAGTLSGTIFTAGPITADCTVAASFAVDYSAPLPTGNVVINGGASYTDNPVVQLALSASDPVTGVITRMKFSNDNSTWSSPEAYAASREWTFAAGEGVKTVYVMYQNTVGRWSGAISSSITVDTSAPNLTVNLAGTTGLNGLYTSDVTVTVSATDIPAGIASIEYELNGQVASYGGPFAVGSELGHILKIRATDRAGHLTQQVFTFGIDKSAPSGTVSINGGAGFTTTTEVTLAQSASDNYGVSQMQFSNDGVNWTDPEAYAISKAWSLSTGDGDKIVFARFQDAAGIWSSATSSTIKLDTTAPAVTITAPAAGESNTSTPQLIYSVSDGAVVVKIDGIVITKASGDTIGPLSDGTHTIRIEATDDAGLTGFAEVSFVVDITAPVVNIVSPVTGVTGSRTQPLSFDVSEGTVVIKVDGVVVALSSGDTLGPFADGDHTVRVEASDAAGNAGFSEVSFKVDATAPSVVINAPLTGLTGNRSPVLDYTANEGVVVVKVDGEVSNKVAGDALGPFADGMHSVRVDSKDAAGNIGFAEVSFTVDSTPPVVSITSPASGSTPNRSQILTFSASDGTVVVQLDGVTINKVSGALLDTLANGSHTLSVTATDAAGNVGTDSVTFTVNYTAPAVTTAGLPSGTVGVPYVQTLAATGGVLPYSWLLASGTLPAGLTLSPDGVISGTPTTVGPASFTVQVKDAESSTASRSLSIAIDSAALVITSTSPFPDAYKGTPYSATLSAAGGSTPYRWSIASGSLPSGLSLNAGTGVISGTPTKTVSSSFSVMVKDNAGVSISKSVALSVYTVPTVSTSSLAAGSVGTSYSQTLAASGGKAPYTWSISSGSLPDGLSINANTGVVSGTPTTAGTFSFTVMASDLNGRQAGKSLSLTINAARPDLTVTSVSGPASGKKGTKITVAATVLNQGLGSAGSSTLTFYLSTDAGITTSDTKLGDSALSSMPAGTSQILSTSFTIPSNLKSGTYYIGAIADRSGVVTESIETNNAKAGNAIIIN